MLKVPKYRFFGFYHALLKNFPETKLAMQFGQGMVPIYIPELEIGIVPLTHLSFNYGKNNLIGYLHLYTQLLHNTNMKICAHDVNEFKNKTSEETAQWIKNLAS